MRVLITGVYGFIGSHFVKWLLTVDPNVRIVGFGRSSAQRNVGRLTGPPQRELKRFQIIHGDLCDANAVSGLCESIDVVINFAAKTFVDHSLKDDAAFHASNVEGTQNLVRDAERHGVKRFVQISTDEVYGQILEGAYKEDATLNPRNPYAWSKASADLYCLMRNRVSGFPCIVTRTENNFGPYQHRQKALPTFVRAALADEPIPVYGDGMHVRCWLHVQEHCRAVWHLVKCGLVGEVYHVAGEQEMTNIDLARLVLRTLGKPEDRVHLVEDHNIRPGHDRRYALDCSKLKATGFGIHQHLESALAATVQWYAENPEWSR